jgi:hypothetical protein
LILTGDNKSILVGPNNSPSPYLQKHLKNANIPVSDIHLNNFSNVLFKQMLNDDKSWSKMTPN